MKRLAGAILGLYSFAGTAWADDPIPVRNARAVSLPFLRITPRTDALHLGSRFWFGRMIAANDFRISEGSVEDYEVYRFEFGAREPFRGGDLEWSAALQTYGGGFMDPLIDGWHSGVLQWSDPNREKARFGQTTVDLDGVRYRPGTGLGDLKLQWNRRNGNRVFSVAAELPTGNVNRLSGSGDVDFGVGIGLPIVQDSRVEISLHLAGIWQGVNGGLRKVRPFVDQETVAAQYRSRAGETWHVQWQSEASALRTGIPKSDAAHRIFVFGWRRQLQNGEQIELFFTEDRDLFTGGFPALADVGPDFTIGVHWSIKR